MTTCRACLLLALLVCFLRSETFAGETGSEAVTWTRSDRQPATTTACDLLVANAIRVAVSPCNSLGSFGLDFNLNAAGGSLDKGTVIEPVSLIRSIRDANNALIDSRCFVDVDSSFQYSAPMITLVSTSTDNIADYAVYAYALNSLYAAANSYFFTIRVAPDDHYVDYEPIDRRWNRVRLLYDMLTNDSNCVKGSASNSDVYHEECYLVWVDSDLIFLNPALSLHSIIDEHKPADIIISAEYHAETGIANTGCFIIKKSEWSIKFLADWWENYDHSISHDQIFFDRLYKVMLPESGQRIVVLPIAALNSVPPVELSLEPEDSVLHLMGVGNKLREQVLRTGFGSICALRSVERSSSLQQPLDGIDNSGLLYTREAKSLLRRYRAGEGLEPQLGLSRPVLQRIYAARYEEILTESTEKIAIHLSENYEGPACKNVFNIDAHFAAAVGSFAPLSSALSCVCPETSCMLAVLEALGDVREILIQSRLLFRAQQALMGIGIGNDGQEEEAVQAAFAERYYGDLEFLLKLSTVFVGRLLHRQSEGNSGHVATKHKEAKAQKNLLLQALHFSAVVCNDFLDSYRQFDNFYSGISFLSRSRFNSTVNFRKLQSFQDIPESDTTHSDAASDDVFRADISGAVGISQVHQLLELYLDILLQFVSLDQIHLVEEMVLSFHASLGSFYAFSRNGIERQRESFDLSRLHFEKAHEMSLHLLKSGRGNLYQLLQPYLLWGRSLHSFGLYQESFDALLELFCIIDANELILLDQNQRQLSEEHTVLVELYYLNVQNIDKLNQGQDQDEKSGAVISPSAKALCDKSTHGINKQHVEQQIDMHGEMNEYAMSIDMSGFYVQEAYWRFKLNYLCGLINGHEYGNVNGNAFSRGTAKGSLMPMHASFCQDQDDPHGTIDKELSEPGEKKKILRRRKKIRKSEGS